MSATPTPTIYTNASQQRLLRLVDLLAGHELAGLEPGAIAKALHTSNSNITRDLDNLRTAGWAEPHPNGKTWRLAPHVIELGRRYSTGLLQGRQQLSDLERRYGL